MAYPGRKGKLSILTFLGNLVASNDVAIEVDDSFLDLMLRKYDDFAGAVEL